MKPHNMTADEFVQRVAHDLVEIMEADREVTTASIAKRAGYSTIAIQQFRSGQYRSFRLAVRLSEVIPEITKDVRCACCGGLPIKFR